MHDPAAPKPDLDEIATLLRERPALIAAVSAYLLVPDWAPPVAFAAGVLGPLIGADLFHLDDIKELGTGMASIGGAGTFDGIVLSGLVATLLA